MIIEANPYWLIRAKLYAEVYSHWDKAWAENAELDCHGGAQKHALQALEDFDKTIDMDCFVTGEAADGR